MRLLWDVCQVPDFRKVAPAEHASLCARLFRFLHGGGRIPTDWLARQIARIDRTDGDIDALSKRLAYIRTWTYAAQRGAWVDDSLRRARRLEPLPADEEATALTSAQNTSPPEQARFVDSIQRALTAAVARLEPRDRLRLACYYAQNLTLAQIGRTLREHEATASRNLARTRRAIRADVEQQLRQTGMGEAEVAECFATVSADAGPLDLNEILPKERRQGVPGEREERRSGVPGDQGPRRK